MKETCGNRFCSTLLRDTAAQEEGGTDSRNREDGHGVYSRERIISKLARL